MRTTMKALGLSVFSFLVFALVIHAASESDILRVMGAQGVNLWRLDKSTSAKKIPPALVVQDHMSVGYGSHFTTQWFRQPLDHFDNSTRETFLQRYWVNSRHYRSGNDGPVIVLDGGETSGEDRLPFLDTGIVDILARATGGVGVVLEHRYYGNSIPVSNFSTDSLRWLNNAQSAADSANFMKNIEFDGIDEDLTAPGTPWIYYGGSYAGARAAHMRLLYPELVFGAIASSAVTHASISNWEYMEVIRQAADSKCSTHLVNSIKSIDNILGTRFKRSLKGLFGLADLEHDEDFVSVLESPLSSWQDKNWDPEVDSMRFEEFCEALGKPPFGFFNDPALLDLIPYGEGQRKIHLTNGFAVDFTILNYAKYIKKHYVSKCPKDNSIEDCFGTFDSAKYQDNSLSETWRAWIFQVCTEWGYFTTAPPDQNQPRIISRLLTLEYLTRICPQAFPPGAYFKIPHMPNISTVNVLGDFDIAADRLAIIDGEVDPWKPFTPHSMYANDRQDTILRPFKLITNGVHHYDEYGLRNIKDEPPEIRKIHSQIAAFVLEWLKDRKKY